MAIPTITLVTPSTGPAFGNSLVKIAGTNFRTYTPPAYGNTAEITQTATVKVLFGDTPAITVSVFSAEEIVVLAPPYSGNYQLHAFSAVDITVTNLDDNGLEIPTETVTALATYTYERSALLPPALPIESPFKRIPRQLLAMLKSYLLLNSGMTVHTDYSPDGVRIYDADVPSLFLMGPDTQLDAYGAENESYYEAQIDGSAVQWPPPVMHAFQFDCTGISNNSGEFLTLMGAARQFCRANPYFVISADIPQGSQMRLPLVVTNEPSRTGDVMMANLHEFTFSFEIRRVPVLYMPPVAQVWPVTELELQVQKTGGILVEISTL